MQTYASIADVRSAADENGGLLKVNLGQLREALDFKRLGVRVLSQIADALDDRGLGYFPEWVLDANETPRYGDEVRVFVKKSPIGELVSAVLNPTDDGDERLTETAGSSAATTLSEIRQLLDRAV